MQNFVVFQKIPEVDGASELISILKNNNIPYVIDDPSQRSILVANTKENFIVIKIKESDVEKTNLILEKLADKNFEKHQDDHYLYTFSDDDIIDIIANPDEWNRLEIKIADKIAKDRQIQITSEVINGAKRKKIKSEDQETNKVKLKIRNTANWFIIIAILSVINSILLTFELNFHILFGLGITQLIDGVIYGLTGEFGFYNIILCIIVSSIFLMFWYNARKEKNWAFIVGMITYGIDSLLFIQVQDWRSLGLHIFVLIALGSGYMTLLKKKKKNESTTHI